MRGEKQCFSPFFEEGRRDGRFAHLGGREPLSRRQRRGVGFCRWRGGVQHRHERLSGDSHRPVLRPPDRHPDHLARRQYRRQSGRQRVAARVGRGPRRARCSRHARELARSRVAAGVSCPPRRRCHRRHRHSTPDSPDSREGSARRLRRDGRRRPRGSTRPCPRLSGPRRHGPSPSCKPRRPNPVGRRHLVLGIRPLPTDHQGPPCRRLRFRRQAQYPAHVGRAWLPRDGGSRPHHGGGNPRPRPRRRVPFQRPWRS